MATKLSISKSEKTKQGGPVDHLLFFPQPVIGVDEVGRGCLAGAVYAAAVILDDTQDLSSLADSKTLSASRRESLSSDILRQHQVAIGIASVQEIEELNILQASLLAMKRAVEKLKVTSGHVLVDGTFKIPGLSSAFEQTTLIQGDSRAKPVAAASIVAKVARDSEMQKLASQYPEYFFEKHKGYSTALHKNQIKKLGPCPLHRKTFAGVKEYVISENQKR